jgi:hypothetical protein
LGFDRDDFSNVNYYGGVLDNVRIWNTVRSARALWEGMFRTYGTSPPISGLLAEWRLDGNGNDATGQHHGSLIGNGQYVNEGALPHDIRIPQVSNAPSLDGFCSTSEYAGATQVTLDGSPVWLQHTHHHLWICFENLGDTDKAYIYLDPQLTREDPAKKQHLALRIHDDDSTSALWGKGDGTYDDTVVADGKWEGRYATCCGDFPTSKAEARIDADLVNDWQHVIGLALGKFTQRRRGDFWPALAEGSLPSTWSRAELEGNMHRVSLPIVLR